MKKQIIFGILSLLTGMALFYSCTENPNNWDIDSQYNRMFRPTDFVAKNVSTLTADLSWKAIAGAKDYEITLSQSADFTKDVKVFSAMGTELQLAELFGETVYYVKLVARSQDGSKMNSNPSILSFTTKGQQIMESTVDGDITDNSIEIRWKTNEGTFDQIGYTVISSNDTTWVSVAEADFLLGTTTITGLTTNTSYYLGLYSGKNRRGYKNFTTKSGVPPSDQTVIFDRSTHTFDQALFTTFMPGNVTLIIPEGDPVVAAVTSINIPDGVMLTIMADPKGKISKVAVPTFHFLGNSNGNTGLSIRALEIVSSADPGSNQYLINHSNAVTVQKIEFIDCNIHDFTACLFRTQGSTSQDFKEVKIDNCIFTKIGGGYSFFTVAAGQLRKIKISNSTFYDMVKPADANVAHSFITSSANDTEEISITNCTFNNFIGSGRFFIDLNTKKATQSFMISNCIFGQTQNVKAKGIRQAGTNLVIDNCYKTTDFVLDANAITGLIEYSGKSMNLFDFPESGTFTIKDPLFEGRKSAGDPRWYSE